MFTFPPYPPKDYVLQTVPKLQRDSAQFTPESEPRVTQTSLGVFCSPVQYEDGESPEKVEIQTLSPQVIKKMVNEARAEWVEKPGKDDYFLHKLYTKYNVKGDNYNPAYRHMEKVFNRSYKYELVCLEERRLQKLRSKCETEQAILEDAFKIEEKKEHEESHPPMKVLECKAQPPFWWKQYRDRMDSPEGEGGQREVPSNMTSYGGDLGKPAPSGRWAKEPCLTAVRLDDPCRRKLDMQSVGRPFKTEACNFYYTNYPPPDVKFRPKKIL